MNRINVLFKTIAEELDRRVLIVCLHFRTVLVIIGGDFNVIFDQELGGSSGLNPLTPKPP